MITNLDSQLATLKSTKWQLFWVSFIILFLEIMALRWMGMEFPTVRTFPNLIIMVILIAISGGLTASASKLANMRIFKNDLPFFFSAAFLLISLIAAPILQIYRHSLNINQSIDVLTSSISFFLLIIISLYIVFLKLGYSLAPLFDQLPPLSAYGINLLGSICGVIVFAVISYMCAPPALWLVIVGIIAYLIRHKRSDLFIACVFALLAFSLNHTSYWSPYSKLDIMPMEAHDSNNPLIKGSYFLNSNNDLFHTGCHPLLGDDVKRYLTSKTDANPVWLQMTARYFTFTEVPFFCAPSCNNVLVLGAGSGNDVACALAKNAKHIDAVEIDPVICQFGRIRHPDHPFLNPRVSLYNEDARTFLRNTKNKYDLVEFALLDPGATIRAASFLRIDNYVYTTESIKSVLQCLSPNGLAVVIFAPDPANKITARLYYTIKAACGVAPVTFIGKNIGYVMLFFGPGICNIDKALKQHSELEKHSDLKKWIIPSELADTRICTDQWPFLYADLNYKGIAVYFGILLIVIVGPSLWIFLRHRKNAKIVDMGNMFFLGLAFMLIETKSIVELSLLFGSTWIVSSVVITTVLSLAYLSNFLVQRSTNKLPLIYLYAALLISLALQYFLNIPNKTDWPPILIASLATIIACLPIFFSSTIFSYCFREAEQPSASLAANLLGVAFGGLTENFSLLLGIKSLVPIALIVYCLSALCLANSKLRLLFKN